MRPAWDNCPQCNKPLRWLHIEDEWYPCDHEPIMFMLHTEGRNEVIYNRKVYKSALIYSRKDSRFKDNIANIKSGYIQHFYTCEVLKSERKEWAKKKYGN